MEKRTGRKAFVLCLLTAIFMMLGLVSEAFSAAQTPNLQIHIYMSQDAENSDMEAGIIDINDWPLSHEWISRWAFMFHDIGMASYVEMGMTQIDLNNQRWPTGDSGSKFYNPARPQSTESCEFRKAIACLIDRNKIVSDPNYLGGSGYRMDLPLPPFQSDFLDMANYTASGLIYDYNKTRAIEILNNAGFTLGGNGLRIDPLIGNTLAALTFCIREDDATRRQIGEMLRDEMRAVGIPVNAFIASRTACYKRVMVAYDYHLYTGGWGFEAIPDQYYDQYSSYTYYGPAVGWSENYLGFCNHEFDTWASKVKYPATITEARQAAKTCGYLFLKYCAVVPMYCLKATKACRTGWIGCVNEEGYGVDNYWTFMNMRKTGDDTLDWGFRSDIEQLNIISSEWLWDQKVLGLMYEGMLGSNPFNLAPTEFWIANNYTIGSWDASSGGGDADATYMTFTIKNNVTFHNITGGIRTPVTTLDINFSFYFTYQCGPGVAWNYPSLAQFNSTVVNSPYDISIKYNKKSAWAVQWAGFLPIVNRDIWGHLTPGMWVKTFDPVSSDMNSNGIADIKEDGTGGWMFDDYSYGSYVKLIRDDSYYLGSTNIENRLLEMFHIGAGDVNRDMVVSILDLWYMVRSLGTNSGMPHGTGWGQYNPDCDLNSDGYVNVIDIATVTMNYGRVMGCCMTGGC